MTEQEQLNGSLVTAGYKFMYNKRLRDNGRARRRLRQQSQREKYLEEPRQLPIIPGGQAAYTDRGC